MKKLYKLPLFLLMLLPLLSGCKKDDILFNSEMPRFELREGYILLEAIVPYGTTTDDQIYIIGDFNGGMDAVGNPMWLMEKAYDYDYKYGIYLDPATFASGTSLASGYTFYNSLQGEERTVGNKPVTHRETASTGQRVNVVLDYWEEFYKKPQNPEDVVHDGYAIFALDKSGYEETALYIYKDDAPFINGEWPGLLPTGTVTINNMSFKYWDTGAENQGADGVNLIFNNNNNGAQLPTFGPVTLNQDFYFQLTEGDVIEFDPYGEVVHDGYAVFVYDATGWDVLQLYMWGDVNDLNGGWPGMAPTGTQEINGVVYQYFDFGEANTGLSENLIFNNNVKSGEDYTGEQLSDFAFTIDRDLYLYVTKSRVMEIDPETFDPNGGAPTNPTYSMLIENNTGWEEFYVYSWSESGYQAFGDFPGQTSDKTTVLNGVTYMVFTIEDTGDQNNLIFSNGTSEQDGGLQYNAFNNLTFNQNYIIVAGPESASMLGVPEGGNYTIYMHNLTSWDALAIYGWGDAELFGGWPGTTFNDEVEIAGIQMLTAKVNSPDGIFLNLILNSPGAQGVQYDFGTVAIDRNLYFAAPDPADKPVPTEGKCTIYVEDITGWGDLTIYAWGSSECFGGWPGAQPSGTVSIGGVSFKYWTIDKPTEETEEAVVYNLIFNNNNGGIQYDAATIQPNNDLFFVAVPQE